MKNENIHIGELICNKLKDTGRSKAWLADKLCYQPDAFYKVLKKPSMDTFLLLHISKILEHDFFTYYSDLYQNR